MKYLDNIKKVIKNTRFSFKRFPLVMLSSIILAIVLISATFEDTKTLTRLSYTFFFAMFNFLFFKLLIESIETRIKDSGAIKIGISILSILIVIVIHFFVLNRIVGSSIIQKEAHLYFGLIVFYIVGSFFIGIIYKYKEFVPYVIKILFAGLISNIYSVVIYLGISAIYFSLKELFGVNITGDLYIRTSIVIFIPYNIGIFLSNYPKVNSNLENYELAKSFRVLLEYILTPILTIYTLILFAYFSKIIFTRTLPKNIITNLVLWYGGISVINIIFLSWIEERRIGKYFNRILPIAILPLLALMFYSIFLRIRQYGVTENRYYVSALGLWVAISMLYLIISKRKTKIVLPVILSIIILFSSMGPISAYNVASNSQNKRFERLLLKNNMLNNAKIIANANISDKDKEEITSIVSYMQNKHRKGELKYLPEDFTANNYKEVFGFSSKYPENSYDFINYNLENLTEINIAGYDKMFKMDFYSGSTATGEYYLTKNDEFLTLYRKSQTEPSKRIEIAVLNMNDIKSKLEILRKENAVIKPDDLSISGEKDGLKFKIIFTNLGFNLASTNIEDYYGDFYILLKENSGNASNKLN